MESIPLNDIPENSVETSFELIKDKGNAAYKTRDFLTALTYFTQAIHDIDGISDNSKLNVLLSTCLTNRSLCHANLEDWLITLLYTKSEI